MEEAARHSSQVFPPVVTVLGHVDHGKTTLLDAIRKTSIVKKEHGGITQSIGASSVVVKHEGRDRKITFLDTPGHEAFSAMRGRGAKVADIGLLIVSAADGIKPQTQESIKLLKEASIPFIVVITKIDLETAQPDRVKKQLLKEQVMVEGMGGDIPVIEVSATADKNIKELLDLILLVSDMKSESKSDPKHALSAVVIESRLDPRVGPKASVVIKDGTIRVRDEVACDDLTARVRSLVSDKNEMVKEATIGDAVEILGFSSVPSVGSIVERKGESKVASVESKAAFVSDSGEPKEAVKAPLTKELSYQELEEGPMLSIILVADTQGSLEAIEAALPEDVRIITSKTGHVSENDILMAKSTKSIVLSFSAKIPPSVAKLALVERVLAREYTIIYEMLDEIRDVLEGKKQASIEQILGRAKVQALFPFDKQTVLGLSVTEGRVAKGDKVRIERGDTIVGEASITSVRSGKQVVSKVEKGSEGGILVSKPLDFRVGDMVLSHS